eukprot:SAG31_NODE_32756_length_352_cov_0.604743_1_plen_111_part_10
MPQKPSSLPDFGLYPTAAASDAYSAVLFGLGARLCAQEDMHVPAAGLSIVVAASTVGVLRYGISERRFITAHQALADTSVCATVLHAVWPRKFRLLYANVVHAGILGSPHG